MDLVRGLYGETLAIVNIAASAVASCGVLAAPLRLRQSGA